MYGAANVDGDQCPEPFDVRFDRDSNRHIAFGGGVTPLLGSHLARRELRVTLTEWHRRIPDYWLSPGHEDLEYPSGLRHVKDLNTGLAMIKWSWIPPSRWRAGWWITMPSILIFDVSLDGCLMAPSVHGRFERFG